MQYLPEKPVIPQTVCLRDQQAACGNIGLETAGVRLDGEKYCALARRLVSGYLLLQSYQEKLPTNDGGFEMYLIALILAGSLVGTFNTQPGDWISLGGVSGEEVSVELVESSREGLVITVELPGFFLTEIPAGGTVYDRVELPGAASSWDYVGMPEVPLVPSLIGVPEGLTAVITGIEIESVVFDDILLYPAQEPATDNDIVPGPFTIDEAAYSSGLPWPSTSAMLDMPGSLSGVDVVRLVAEPFRYTASERKLEVARSMRISIVFEGTAEAQTPVSPAIQRVQSTLIINHDALAIPENSGTDADDPVYIVITVDANLDAITPLLQVEHVLGHHICVEVVPDGSSASAIMNSIALNYESGVSRFVLIAGRHQEITAFNYGAFHGDFFYSVQEGGNYPSVGLARISEFPDKFQNQIDKTFSYMTHTGTPGVFPITATGAMAAHEEGYPGGYTANKNTVVTWDYTALDPVFDTFYPLEGATAEGLSDRIDAGVGTINYRGHGSNTVWQWSPGWNTGHIYNLENTFYPPVYNICCNNGKHEFTYNCLAESWMDAEGLGASGTCGAAEASYTTANNRLDRAIYWSLYDNEISNAAEGFAWALSNMITFCGGLGITNSRMYHWFGDPAMDIYTTDELGAPFELVLGGNTATGPGNQNQTYSVTSGGSPVEGVLVTASDGIGNHPDDPESFYVQGTTSASGQVTLNFTAVEFDDITVGAWKHNYAIDTMLVTVGDTGTGSGPGGSVLSMSTPRPNPCRSEASVDYSLPVQGDVSLSVYDLAGRSVAVLASGQFGEGSHSAVWNTSDIPAGLYILKLDTSGGSVVQKLMVVR
jgi:hypothetical protein